MNTGSSPSGGPPAKRGRGRPRGRPPGSGVGRTSAALGRSSLSGRGMSRRPRGRGSTQKAVAAAELAAAQAGKSAGYAAYGYSYKKGMLVLVVCAIYYRSDIEIMDKYVYHNHW